MQRKTKLAFLILGLMLCLFAKFKQYETKNVIIELDSGFVVMPKEHWITLKAKEEARKTLGK